MWWPSLGRKRRRCCGLALLVLTTSLLLQAIEARAHGAAAADSPDLNEIEPYAERSGVAGESVHLPCPTKTKSNNSVVLVLWYKELILEPIYVFDIRRSMAEPKRRSSPKALGNRAYFNENMEPAQLIIKNLMPNDEGLYTCRVDFANSPTTSHKFNLTVIEKPSKPEILDGATRLPIRDIQKVYNEGSDISLICRTRGGNPAPQVVWFHGGQKIDDSFEHRPDNDETLNHLLFTKVGRQHLNSQLVCQASNTNKSSPQSAILNLDINLKPTDAEIVTKEPKFMAGNKFELECRSTGSKPNAVITWWMANKRIDNQTESYSKNNQSVSILKFVPSIDDEGKYLTCRAENPNMEDSAIEDRLQLNVQYQPVVNLRLGAKLDPDVIKEGDDVYFECSVRANPKPYKLAWYKDSVEMRNNQSAGIVLSDRSLVLRGVTRNSAGDYACLAANSEGKTYSNPVPLRVMYAPVCKEGRSEVVVGALKQETVSLLCGVESHPEPLTFHWTFNNSGEPIEMPSQPQARSGGNSHAASSTGSPPSLASQQQQQQQGESAAGVLKEYHGARMNYTPATEMDYGTVACWASNKVGRQRSPCMFQVIAAGRPNALHNCTATEMSRELDEPRLNGNNIPTSTATGTGLLVTCLEGYNGGLPIKSYHVDVVSDEDGGVVILNRTVEAAGSRTGAVGPGGGGGGGGLLQQTSGVDSSATIEVAGLSTGKSYRLFLYAVNAKGRSEPAMLEHVTLKGVAMYTTGNADISAFSPLLLGLAATATLLALAVAGILAALYRKHSGGLAGSPKHAPIVCEPPNAGSTTPVHPQTKQPIDDIDPDIIPNEYERRPLTYTSAVYKTPPQRRRRDRGGGGGGGSSSPEELNSTSPEKKPMVVQPVQPQPLPPQQQHLLSHRPSLDSGEMALLAEHNTPAPTIPRTYVPNHHPGYATHRVLASPPGAGGGGGGYSLSPTLADFKQMAFDAYNQRQNVYYSLQRASSALSTMPQQRPLPSSQSIHGKIHQPVTEVVTRSNRVQESCI